MASGPTCSGLRRRMPVLGRIVDSATRRTDSDTTSIVKQLAAILMLVVAASSVFAQPGSRRRPWTPEQAQSILDRTARTRLAPDLSHLTAGERQAVAKLLDVGQIFQSLYEQQRHRDAVAARTALERARDVNSRNLLTLYRLFQGPIATTLDNRREPFLSVDEAPPGKNVYPWDLTGQEFETFLTANPGERRALTHLRSVVRRAEPANLARDLAALARHPSIDTLHPGLEGKLTALTRAPNRRVLYAVPYSVAYADEMIKAHALLHEAAAAVESDDQDLARYLRNRARDLLTDDYEAADASWITGRFKRLNAQIGAYETYDDELTGTRAFYSLSLLAVRTEESAALRKALQGV